MRKIFLAVALFALVALPMVAMAAVDTGIDTANPGLGDADPKDVIKSIIQVILGFLGLVSVIIILAGGFMWMTAGGNEEKVTKGRKFIINGIIGLVIVLAAYGIAQFVINSIGNATGLGA